MPASIAPTPPAKSPHYPAPVTGTSLDAVPIGGRTGYELSAAFEAPNIDPPVGTVTFLFSDIVDSAALNGALGDRRWLELLHEHDRLVRSAVAEVGGFAVKHQGDGFMLAFQGACAGVRAAVTIQRAIHALDLQLPLELRVRIGLHTGDAIRERMDYFGRHVILAARLCQIAAPGSILVSALVWELVAPAGEFSLVDAETRPVKGFEEPQPVCTVRWTDPEVSLSLEPADSRYRPDSLTTREMEVLRLVADGLRNREIADELVISPATVTRHVSNLLSKTGLSSRTKLVRYASDRGLVE